MRDNVTDVKGKNGEGETRRGRKQLAIVEQLVNVFVFAQRVC